MRALVQLEDYWVDQLAIKDGRAPIEHAKERVTVLPKVDFEVFKVPDGEYYVVTMGISAGAAKVKRGIPYQFRLHLTGVFSFAPGTDEDIQTRLINVSGPAMLYGIARGIIGEMTGASRGRRYVLPSINFVELSKKRSARKPANSTEG